MRWRTSSGRAIKRRRQLRESDPEASLPNRWTEERRLIGALAAAAVECRAEVLVQGGR